MKHVKEICCVLAGVFISTIIWGYFMYLIPVGSVDGVTLRKYQLNERLNRSAGNTVKSIGKEIAFEKAMNNLKISIKESEVDKEFNEMLERYGGSDEVEEIMLDMMGNTDSLRQSVKNGMLKQKAIEYFAGKETIMPDNIQSFYEQHKNDYGDFDSDYQKIRTDCAMEAGAEKYEEYIRTYEEKVTIKIY
ncbi:MAG: hypothetical protein BWY15_02262 [Firmicutes bacterium ADurb.Bin193]|nr:MAG: hypothetical protein BWY15_02262 [Firmicutes bacterium ADurb.Bin193]